MCSGCLVFGSVLATYLECPQGQWYPIFFHSRTEDAVSPPLHCSDFMKRVLYIVDIAFCGPYTVTWSMAGSRVQTGCNDRKDWIRIVWFEFLWCYCLRSNFSLWVVSYFCEKFMSDQWNGTIMYVPCTCMCVYVLYVCDCCDLMCS